MNWIFAATFSLAISGDLLPPQPDEVLRLPDSVISELESRVTDRSRLSDKRLDLLVDYMFADDGLDFSYIVGPTRNPADTYAAREGNCLSFTLLFLALADQVGINAAPREVRVPLNWRRDGSALFESGHVNVLVRTEARRAVVDFEPDPDLSRRLSLNQRSNRISRERVLAHFYNNRAAELLGEGKPGLARLWSEHAVTLDPDFTAALNNRGVIEARLGEHDLALTFYRRALAIDADNRSALFNMHELFRRTGQRQRAGEALDRLEALRSSDPYVHWALARNLERLGEFKRAEKLYLRAIRMKDDDPLFHTGLAQVALALGDHERAERALSQAMALSRDQPNREIRWNEQLLFLKARLPGV